MPFAGRHAKQFAMRELTKRRALWTQGLSALAVGLGFGVMAPFGTGAVLSPGGRFAYWLIAVPLNWLQISVAIALIERAPFALTWSPLRRGLTAALALSIPATFEITWLQEFFLHHPIDSLAALSEMYLYVLLVSVMLTVPSSLIFYQSAPSATASAALTDPAPAAMPIRPPFFDRIRAELGTDLLALEMEDHYLRIHTAAGSDLILCRFGDAVKELQGFDGLQIHRSWWIARRAIARVERDGQKMTVTLTNGIAAPVSRSFQKELR